MDTEVLMKFLKDQHFPDYRFRQIVKNYYSGRFDSFAKMTDLPLSLRDLLASKIPFLSVKAINIQDDKSSQKALLELQDNQKIESVHMYYDNWHTVCLSTQVGCPLKCAFCATGKMGFKRNLTSEEIVDQIIFWKQYLLKRHCEDPGLSGDVAIPTVNRLVFMGMGEPFLNWDNLLTALKVINNPNSLNIGSRKISISTAGIVPRIIDFANLNTQINLAISLHSASQQIRQSIMPIARQYSLNELLDVCLYYVKKTNRQLFFEYALIDKVNDDQKSLSDLIKFIKKHHLFFLNIINLNLVKGGLNSSRRSREFISGLTRARVPFSIRKSLGSPISAACGQLAANP